MESWHNEYDASHNYLLKMKGFGKDGLYPCKIVEREAPAGDIDEYFRYSIDKKEMLPWKTPQHLALWAHRLVRRSISGFSFSNVHVCRFRAYSLQFTVSHGKFKWAWLQFYKPDKKVDAGEDGHHVLILLGQT